MAENFQAEVCGGSWPWQWNGLFSSSPCFSSGINNIDNLGGFGCLNPELLDNKLAWSSDESGSPSDGSIVVQEKHQIIMPTQHNSSLDSSSQILGMSLSSSMSTNDWNRTLFHGDGSCEAMNYPAVQQEDQSCRMNHGQETGDQENINSFESVNQDEFSILDQKPSNYISNIPQNSSPLSKNFPTYDYSSNLLHTLFETEPQTQQPFYDHTRLMNGCPSDTTNYQATLNEFSRNSLSELSSSMVKQKPTNLSAKAKSCNSLPLALNDFPISPFPPGPQFFPTSARPSLPNFKAMITNDHEVQGLGTVAKKSNCEPTFKRPRIETPTPLPTFKVRKEKMGDRITALQQLVSPFGKTDTASVLHEAIEYIKFLHDQVNALSTPYLKNGVTIQRLQDSDKSKEQVPKPDLKNRGLCLVPISSTFPVAAETTTDFWIPTFGGTFR